ncbi:hypothetical protein HLB35_15895 [Halomonas sp. TBZ9]|uniref:Uncharacterized protein n=1 Tax=Vreelandella azerica TaxID=2732867 RepID=A0A7Y3XAK7_9GAMM|nr:hypothetical protein [Halomonas azerica]NOG32877.1 hypothetical protein [Halomonas azerica]
MNAAAIEISERMSADDIEHELKEIADVDRLEGVKHGNRDFELETKQAENDPLKGPAVAAEIRAEATIYRAHKNRRDARRESLKVALKHLQDNDIGERLAGLKKEHDRAVNAATAALAAVDFSQLDTFEKQLEAYLDAAALVRGHAVVAAQTASNAGATAPGLTSVKAPAVEALHDRLNRLAVRVASPDLQARGDLSRWGVERSTI